MLPEGVFYDRLVDKGVCCMLGEPTRRRPVLPIPAQPRRPAVRRSVSEMSGFWIREKIFMETWRMKNVLKYIIQRPNLSNPKPEHTTGGSGRRGAQRGGGARRGWAEQDADGSGGPEAGYGRCGGSRYLWREPLRMKATEGASRIRPSPSPLLLTPHIPCLHREFRVLG